MSGTWLPPATAARVLGISDRTLRRRVAAGLYQVERDRDRRRTRVLLPEDVTNRPGASAAADDPVHSSLLLLVDRLLAGWSRLEQLDTAVNALSDQLDAFQRRLEQQDERLRSLEAAQHRAAFQEQFA